MYHRKVTFLLCDGWFFTTCQRLVKVEQLIGITHPHESDVEVLTVQVESHGYDRSILQGILEGDLRLNRIVGFGTARGQATASHHDSDQKDRTG